MATPLRGFRGIERIYIGDLEDEAEVQVRAFKETGDVLADLLYVQGRLNRARALERECRRDRDLAIAAVDRFWYSLHGARFHQSVGLTSAALRDVKQKMRNVLDIPDWLDAPERAQRAAIATIRAGREADLWRPIRNRLMRRVSAERGLSNLRIAQRTDLDQGTVSRILREGRDGSFASPAPRARPAAAATPSPVPTIPPSAHNVPASLVAKYPELIDVLRSRGWDRVA